MAEAKWIFSRDRVVGTFAWTADRGREIGVAVVSMRPLNDPGRAVRQGAMVATGIVALSRDGETVPSVRPFKWEEPAQRNHNLGNLARDNAGPLLQAICMAAAVAGGASFDIRVEQTNSQDPVANSAVSKLEMLRAWQRETVDSPRSPHASEEERQDRNVLTVSRDTANLAVSLSVMSGQCRPSKQIRVGHERDGFSALSLFVAGPGTEVPRAFAEAGVTSRTIPKELSTIIARAATVDEAIARSALSAVSFPTSRAAAWYGDIGSPSLGDRQQAAAATPVLAGIIAASPALAGAVDRRLPLQPLILERTGLSKGGLKRLSKLTEPLVHGVIFDDGPVRGQDALGVDRLRVISLRGRFNEDDACRILCKLPPDWTPEDNASWKAFREVCSAMVVPLSQVLGADPVDLLQASKGKWTEFRDALARAADIDPAEFDRERIALSTIDAIQVVDELSRHVVLPLVLNTIAGTGQPVAAALPGDLDLGRNAAWNVIVGNSKNKGAALYEVARRWASRIPSLDAIVRPGAVEAPARVEREQPLVCGPFTASNGRVIRNLNHPDLLVEESSRLGHCVGRLYLRKSEDGDCHIFSVQNDTGEKSFSTVEFTPLGAGNLQLVQHRARSNAVPDDASELAVVEFMDAVRDGRFSLDVEAAISWRDYKAAGNRQGGHETAAATPQPASSWKGALGCDCDNEESMRALWDEWKNIIGEKWASSETSGILFKSAQVRDLVDAFSPAAAGILRRQQAERRIDVQPEVAGNGPEF